jgi:hypothetical protein
MRGPSHVRGADRGTLGAELVVDAPQAAAEVVLRQLVPVQIERLDRVMPGLEPGNRRELKRLPRVGPIAAAAAAFGRAVVQQEAMAQGVLRAADGQIDGVLADAQRLSRSPADVQVLGLKRRDVFAELGWHGAIRALADSAQLAVHLRRRLQGVLARQGRLDVALEPLVAQVFVDARVLGIVVERVGEPERAPARIEVERPFDARRQTRRPLLGLLFSRLPWRVLRTGSGWRHDAHSATRRQETARDIMSLPVWLHGKYHAAA